MNKESAFKTLATHVLRIEESADRLALIDALATVATAASLTAWAAETAQVADALRAAESLQLNFLERLNPPPSPQ